MGISPPPGVEFRDSSGTRKRAGVWTIETELAGQQFIVDASLRKIILRSPLSGYSLPLNGVDQSVKSLNTFFPAPGGSSNYTLEGWIYFPTQTFSASYRVLCILVNNSGTREIRVNRDSVNPNNARLSMDSQGTQSGTLFLGVKWYYVQMACNNSSRDLRVGTETTPVALDFSAASQPADQTSNVFVGASINNTLNQWVTGFDWRLWDYKRTAAEGEANKLRYVPPTTPGLLWNSRLNYNTPFQAPNFSIQEEVINNSRVFGFQGGENPYVSLWPAGFEI